MAPSSVTTTSPTTTPASTPFNAFLRALPKCEHHIHIEGSLSPTLLFALSAKNSIPLPPTTTDPAFASTSSLLRRYGEFTSLDDFLHYYYVGFSVLLRASDFEALAYDYLSRVSAQDNLRHAEIFFDPQMHTSRGVPLETVIGGLNSGRERARREFGVTSLLIPCLLRHLPVSDGQATFDALRDGGFFEAKPDEAAPACAGLGISSSEKNVPPPSEWAPIFHAAASLSSATTTPIRLTAHAGEEGPASSVSATLDSMLVSRIDHGVRAAEDPLLLARLARDRILLTVCPLSNLRLKVVADLNQVPIRKLLDVGVPFSVNSDDPAYFGGYVLDNYVAVQEAFGLSVDDWARICRDSIELSWCGEGRKGELLEELERVVGEWRRRLEAPLSAAAV